VRSEGTVPDLRTEQGTVPDLRTEQSGVVESGLSPANRIVANFASEFGYGEWDIWRGCGMMWVSNIFYTYNEIKKEYKKIACLENAIRLNYF